MAPDPGRIVGSDRLRQLPPLTWLATTSPFLPRPSLPCFSGSALPGGRSDPCRAQPLWKVDERGCCLGCGACCIWSRTQKWPDLTDSESCRLSQTGAGRLAGRGGADRYKTLPRVQEPFSDVVSLCVRRKRTDSGEVSKRGNISCDGRRRLGLLSVLFCASPNCGASKGFWDASSTARDCRGARRGLRARCARCAGLRPDLCLRPRRAETVSVIPRP